MPRFFGEDEGKPGHSPPSFASQGLVRVPGIQPLPPSSVNPLPGVPGSQPGSIWVGGKFPLQFEANEELAVFVATWGTPIFDLRAELKGAMSERPQAQPIRPFQGAKVYAQIDGWATLDSSVVGLRVFSAEWGSIQSSEDVRQLSAELDVTQDAYGGRNSDPLANSTQAGLVLPTRSVLVWEPPPSRLRYWQVKLRFVWDFALPPVLPAAIHVCGGMY